MNAGTKTVRRLASQPNRPASDSICSSCLFRLSNTPSQIRTAATAAAAAPSQTTSTPPSAPDAATNPILHPAYQVRASVVLSRPPLLTRELHPFEKAFYLYQRRLNERLALPFTRYFYYKKGTPADVEWKRKIKQRLTPARDIGVYNAYGREGWNDEVLVGDQTAEPEVQVEALIRDLEHKGEEEGEKKETESNEMAVQRPLSRVTGADKSNDERSLDRQMERSLYLLVQNAAGKWRFPEDTLQGREGLHQAAERVIVQAGGINMNTWVVGNAPIGHYQWNFEKAIENVEKSRQEQGEKVFFMKARIMAGQANLEKNTFGDKDFKWLSKEEIEKFVTRGYWSSIKNMLSER
ncbi:hypothetical protein M8818_005650 [Zalaria obscura]|uniref:Uncharacterized protein n=1 Tax=Zalaria obscura TaxID=2024903 RepID=A0ACC3S8K3_9PEZI